MTSHCVRVAGVFMQQFLTELKRYDVTLWCRLQEQQLRPEFFAFRWLTLLLSQEFDLPGDARHSDVMLYIYFTLRVQCNMQSVSTSFNRSRGFDSLL